LNYRKEAYPIEIGFTDEERRDLSWRHGSSGRAPA
jgi:hypothetical protein